MGGGEGAYVIGFAVDFVDGVALVNGVLEGSGDRAAMSRFTKALERLATGGSAEIEIERE